MGPVPLTLPFRTNKNAQFLEFFGHILYILDISRFTSPFNGEVDGGRDPIHSTILRYARR